MNTAPRATCDVSSSFLDTVEDITEGVRAPGDLRKVEGLAGASKAFFLAQLWKQHKRPLLVVTPDTISSELLLSDLRYFLKHENDRSKPHYFPTWELLPYEPLSPLVEVSGERLGILHSLLEKRGPLIVTSVEALHQLVVPRSILKEQTYHLRRGETMDRELLELCLVDNGFERSHLVEERGQFSSRGDILDLYLPSHMNPIRIEFFGDDVESIRHFDVNSQVSVEEVDHVTLLPVRELCLNQKQIKDGVERIIQFAAQHEVHRSHLNELIEKIEGLRNFSGIENLAPFFYPAGESLLDYLTPETLLVLDEPDAMVSKSDHFHDMVLEHHTGCRDREEVVPDPELLYLSPEALYARLESQPRILLNSLKLGNPDDQEVIQFDVKLLPQFQGKFESFSEMALDWIRQDQEVTVVAPTKGHVRRVNELLVEHEINLPVELGHISSGFKIPDHHQIFVAEHEIFGKTHKHRHRRKPRSVAFQRGFQDLKMGDMLVHVDYGIGKFNGSKELKTGIGSGEFLEIIYADDQKLYIPMDGLAFIQKYLGSDEAHPPLSRLGGTQWKRQKKKVQESLREMAEDLLKIYAGREVANGFSYSPDAVQMQEFSDSFEYVETDDQMKAIEEVLDDLGKDKPMDRLVCGDVGYGKTEVAMRAAFKAVLDKKQVAVLVPTTILAQQHLNTFRERFKMYPVSVDMVSRFRTSRQQKETLSKLKQGKLDIIIGTHRLLSKDVQFADLGLLVLDEEQRFGVRHKEQLKKMRQSVDILTLTATPIPRTLHFSLMGVRDLSVIETPPSDRLAIKTYVRKYDDHVIREAITRELERGGQVYFVHNKIHSIHSIAKHLKKVVPGVKIGIAHGQMQERMLETVMRQFIDKEIDLLLATSIVESGLDIPSANTIIINRADQFGLAQLYQLRGRVGRYKHQAFAYLLIPGAMTLSAEARKRLFAIEEMSELGAGFQLAARDMEIRGTGNMLGKNQSGHISTIGFDLYCKMMEETIKEMKGEAVEDKVETEIDLQVKGYIPRDYIPDLNQRLEMYRRLQLASELSEVKTLTREMRDRFGPPLEPVEKLLVLLEIRILSQKAHITKLKLLRNKVSCRIAQSTPVPAQGLMSLLDERMRLITEFEMSLTVDLKGWREDLSLLKEYLMKLTELIDDNQ